MAMAQAPPIQMPGRQLMPEGMSLTKNQIEGLYKHVTDMAKTGVPKTDPEFVKANQLLMQQTIEMRRRQQQFVQQQALTNQTQTQHQNQHQHQNQDVASNVSETQARAPEQPETKSTPNGNGTSLNTAVPNSGVVGHSPLTETSAEILTKDQLILLKQQITAFKCLSKNSVVPSKIQQLIFAQRKRRQAAIEQAIRTTASLTPSPTPVAQSQPTKKKRAVQPYQNSIPPVHVADASSIADAVDTVGVDGAVGAAGATPLPTFAYKSYFDHSQDHGMDEHGVSRPKLVLPSIGLRAHRVRKTIPSLAPPGISYEEALRQQETALQKRMSDRVAQLEALPGNIAHWDSRKDELEADDSRRMAAIIELKKLRQYSRQQRLRSQVSRHMTFLNNLAMTTNRSQFRRFKKQNVREARITEKLEKQQRDAREHRERKKHRDWLEAIRTHHDEVHGAARNQRAKSAKLCKTMYSQHFNIEKEEQKRIERTAKQRLQALKANDEEAYMALLDQAKDTRITHLLRQTDGFLHQLASSVKVQQRQAAEQYGDDAAAWKEDDEEAKEDAGGAGGDGDDNGDGNGDGTDGDAGNRSKIDYYAVAHRVKEEVTEQASILVGGTLKEYQVKGLQWMLSLYNNSLNGILADEMGLGKTIQTISLITYLVEKKNQLGPYLVIVPLSTLTNWDLEFAKWAPSISKLVYKGPPPSRKPLQDRIRRGDFQVLLTTFEYIIKDRPLLSRIKWFHMIIDEGHRMKNSNSKLSSTIQQHYTTRFRLILTGTPLQNNLPELWSLLNFVLPNIFKSVKTFDEWFNTPFANTGGQDKMDLTEEEQILVIRRLHKVLRPFLLRRLKKDVEKDLPDKTEKVIKCKFSALQAKLYKQMVTDNKIVVSDGKGGKVGTRGLSNMIMQLRKLCNHPYVFEEVENSFNPQSLLNDSIWRTAGKFELLDRVLPKYKVTGHRVLMFFQMTAIMDIMEDYLKYRGYLYLRLDGTTKSDERSEMLKDFNAPGSEYFMFLLSTRAGGLGLNLQTADTVIIYDSDWNPHQDLQAQDRAHRIGQKNEVRILRLISSNSVEEKILERARYKLDMDGKVIQAGRFDNKSSETDRDAMLRTLLETADMTDSVDQDEMDDEELNMVLARSDKELVVFQQLDEERNKHSEYGTGPGCKGKSRLMADDELPDFYLHEGAELTPEADEEPLGRSARKRNIVRYDDGLTEEQWTMAVEDDDDSPEAAAARKQEAREQRENNRLRRLAATNSAAAESSPPPSRDGTEDGGDSNTPLRKRGRKPGFKGVEKRKADDADDEPPPAKKRRGPQGRPKTAPPPPVASAMSAVQLVPAARGALQRSLRALFEGLMSLEVEDPEPLSPRPDGQSIIGSRLIIGPFVKLPLKREVPGYYDIIKSPICMRQIEVRIKKGEYNCLADMKRDIDLMFRNCRTFNEEMSMIYQDTLTMEKFFVAKFEEQQAKVDAFMEQLRNQEKENEAVKSEPALTGGTQPAVSGTRIKIVSRENKENRDKEREAKEADWPVMSRRESEGDGD